MDSKIIQPDEICLWEYPGEEGKFSSKGIGSLTLLHSLEEQFIVNYNSLIKFFETNELYIFDWFSMNKYVNNSTVSGKTLLNKVLDGCENDYFVKENSDSGLMSLVTQNHQPYGKQRHSRYSIQCVSQDENNKELLWESLKICDSGIVSRNISNVLSNNPNLILLRVLERNFKIIIQLFGENKTLDQISSIFKKD